MPQQGLVQNAVALARQLKERLDELFKEDPIIGTDVSKAHFSDGKSLSANNGDYILYCFTGSAMYSFLQETLYSIKGVVTQLPIITAEKAALEWMSGILNWVESIKNAGQYNKNKQLFIPTEVAPEILERGHRALYSATNEVQSYLKEKLKIFPPNFNVAVMKRGANSAGLGLLRWAVLLLRCLTFDINKERDWKNRALKAIKFFSTFESEGVICIVSTIGHATTFRDDVTWLLSEAENLIIQDANVICSLSSLLLRMERSQVFQECLKTERTAAEEEKVLADKAKFENPQNIVDDRYRLLSCLQDRLPPPSTYLDDYLKDEFDDNSLFIGESSRDKSRFLLGKSILSGKYFLLRSESDATVRSYNYVAFIRHGDIRS